MYQIWGALTNPVKLVGHLTRPLTTAANRMQHITGSELQRCDMTFWRVRVSVGHFQTT